MVNAHTYRRRAKRRRRFNVGRVLVVNNLPASYVMASGLTPSSSASASADTPAMPYCRKLILQAKLGRKALYRLLVPSTDTRRSQNGFHRVNAQHPAMASMRASHSRCSSRAPGR